MLTIFTDVADWDNVVAAAAVAAMYLTTIIHIDCQADDIADVISDHTFNGLFNLPEVLSTWSHKFWDYFQGLFSCD